MANLEKALEHSKRVGEVLIEELKNANSIESILILQYINTIETLTQQINLFVVSSELDDQF